MLGIELADVLGTVCQELDGVCSKQTDASMIPGEAEQGPRGTSEL